MNLPEKNRTAVLLDFLDAIAKAHGVLGRLPGELVKELEAKYKLSLRDGLLAKVRAVTVILPEKQQLPKGAKALPILVLHMEDGDSATAWEEFLPKLVGEIAGEKPSPPSSEIVNGVKVFSLPATGLPWKSAIHFTRKDAVLVVGQDRKLVAAASTPDAAASVAGGKPLPVPKGNLALLGTLNIGALLGAIDISKTTRPVESIELPDLRPRRGELLPPDELLKQADKARAAFLAEFKQLPPTVIAVRRVENELRLELFQAKVQGGGLTPMIKSGVDWFDKRMNLRNPNGQFYPSEGRQLYGKW